MKCTLSIIIDATNINEKSTLYKNVIKKRYMVFSLLIYSPLTIVTVTLLDFQIPAVKMCTSSVDWQGQPGYVHTHSIKKTAAPHARHINIEKPKKSHNLY